MFSKSQMLGYWTFVSVYFNKNQWHTKDRICLIPSISIGCLSLHTVPLHVCSYYWKSYVDLISEWRLSCVFFFLLLWQGSTPNELWLYTLLFILCWTHRLKEIEMNTCAPLFFSISFFLSFSSFIFFVQQNLKGQSTTYSLYTCTAMTQNDKLQNSCLKLITSGNKSHYDKWIPLQSPWTPLWVNSILKPNEA